MKYVFNYEKYKKWRMEKEKLDEFTIEVIEQFNHYKDLEGKEFNELWNEGKIILKKWCDYVK